MDSGEKSQLATAAALTALRDDMLRFAILQLRDANAAEDAVQEALAAAITNAERFQGRAQIKTWMFAILRNKIVDILRERPYGSRAGYGGEAGLNQTEDVFDRRGRWRRDERPSDWGQPEAEFESAEFWRVFEACLIDLPENIARVFTMREMLGLGTAQICSQLSISERNCWVILHRARMRLRFCLEQKWFEAEKPNADL